MAEPALNELSDQQLEQINSALEENKQVIRSQQIAINQEITRRALRARLDKTKGELAAAGVPAQVIDMIGIESAEKVGNG